jgi:hypothetical protein
MVRKNSPAASAAAPVTDRLLEQARERAAAAQGRLHAAERADASLPGWEVEYAAALAAERSSARRVVALEQLRAGQIEAAGKRDAAVKAAGPELSSAAAELTASRDKVGAAADEHLKALSALAAAADAHNQLLAGQRAHVAELGLRAADDLADGVEHSEGVLEQGGLRVAGTDWTVLPGGGVVAHALRQVYGQESAMHPLSQVGRYVWRAHQVEHRADGLKLPVLAAPAAAAVPVQASRPSVTDMLPPAEVPAPGSNPTGYEPSPARRGRDRSV